MSISRFIRQAIKENPGVIPQRSSSKVKEERLAEIRRGSSEFSNKEELEKTEIKKEEPKKNKKKK